MNIIKLYDKINPSDDHFNNFLKGKYAWWIHMRYIVSFDIMTEQDYVACENNIDNLYNGGFEYRNSDDESFSSYIDYNITNTINSIGNLISYNKLSTGPDITISDIKQFRTWLAKTILTFNLINNDVQTWMLQYYANGMYDDTIKKLIAFSNNTIEINTKTSECGCGSDTSIYNMMINECDPLAIYKKNIYNEMVHTFSDLSFWQIFDISFIEEFKKYIDNIIAVNLPLKLSIKTNKYNDCTCITENDDEYKMILQRLSVSLEYIINNQIDGHKNYIMDSLNDWARNLYETMEW